MQMADRCVGRMRTSGVKWPLNGAAGPCSRTRRNNDSVVILQRGVLVSAASDTYNSVVILIRVIIV